MEYPPPPSTAQPIPTTGTEAAQSRPLQQPPNINHPDSVDSSPRSRHANSCDDPSPSPTPKLRLMCSYGGHIVPRPHDKSLCYIGGDTRIIVIDRHTSVSDLHQRLSKTLLNNQPFTLKYQLPNEDLDSLISVTADEDLENMVEQYDRLNNNNIKYHRSNSSNASGLKFGRLRLFLFPQSSSIEHLLAETSSIKSEDWFLSVLNGKGTNMSAAASDRGFSDSSSVNYLLGLDDDFVDKAATTGNDIESQLEGSKNGANHTGHQDVHSVPGSPMLETTSSFGSTSSSPSVANLPPIRVHVDENQRLGGLGVEERFQQLTVGLVGGVTMRQKQEDGAFMATTVPAGTVVSGDPAMFGGEYGNPVLSDDDRLDHGGNRKPHQQIPVQFQHQQLPQFQQKQGVAIELPSPESVSSEGSVTNPLVRQRQTFYQEPIVQLQSVNSLVSANQIDPKTGDQNTRSVPVPVHESGYVLAGQFEQNQPPLNQPLQFVHSGTQYIPVGATPITSYYPIHSSHHQHHPHHPALEQQYPVYYVPARPSQACSMLVQQPNFSESAPAVPSSRPQTPPSAAYNQARNVPASKAEMAAGVYRTAAPQFFQVPSGQHQAQYIAFNPVRHPSESVTAPSAANSNYAYEFAEPAQSQMYYTQPLPTQFAAQYQTMTSASAMVLPESSTQLPTENMNQQIRT